MVVETGFQANTLKKDSRTRSICICVAPLLTVRSVKTTDASRHFAACASALGTEMSCRASVVVGLSSKLEMPPVAAVFASREISTKTIV